MNRFILIGLGALLGANARYLVSLWAVARWGVAFPYGTLIVNVTGSFALGFLLVAAIGRGNIPPEVHLFLGVGFVGAYTTFSTYTVESLILLGSGNIWKTLINVFANNLVGLASALAGISLARLLAG
jgi:fluoride exporter